VSKDITTVYPSMNYKPKNVFLATFLYQSGTAFQLALVTNGTDIFSVINYGRLASNSSNISASTCSGIKTLIPNNNAKELALTGNKTGVLGRHVFYLTDKDCKPVSGVRVIRSSWRGIKDTVFNSRDYLVHNVLTKNEYGASFIYFKEVVTGGETPAAVVLFKPTLTGPFRTTYGLFNPGGAYVHSSTLFLFENTKKTITFQYGNDKFPSVTSFTVCRRVSFEQAMKSKPSIKILPVINNKNFDAYVNIWLKNVKVSSFVACVKEIIPFSGQHNMIINYIAASAGDRNIQEVSHVTFPAEYRERVTCLIKKFHKTFIKTPDIFITAEVDSNEPSFVWVKSINQREAEICLRTSIHNKVHKIHILLSGEVRPCAAHKCPDHLECHSTATQTAYCGCIQSCVGKEERGEFCSTDYITYKSVCHMNQAHCYKHGNSSKSNTSVKHYGACQCKLYYTGCPL